MEIKQFKLVVMPLRDKMYNLARNILATNSDAEDAVQEAMLRLWSVRSQLLVHPNVQGFAIQTVKNICIDKLRSGRYNVPIDGLQIAESSETPHFRTELNDSVRLVKKIIETLPELQRQIILMRDVEGYELAEIAEIVGTQVSAVTVNLSRARKRVRDKFIDINKIIKE
ncbi:RNA polymerase sigma factor (sigma-70 family) [Dysgonomonas sp. PH5-45]|uniref:RNA polymerase sigma factor n=1 Tax=unclassified Dysgonomonas TaxID=2630389 RepID=UPI002476E6CC|nr:MULTISPECIES: RNA polymerase sigma factor [unclassified Dysgonomonas]MDH6355401.1 RNA polymerase sigma factor (sigma-70 family) [Dysgonomonas sp. PH5-45]MDH6388298.1 RNA polymerase sigma factor (sigma-70 family) [Dysgonomonas sp. PH5-37]